MTIPHVNAHDALGYFLTKSFCQVTLACQFLAVRIATRLNMPQSGTDAAC